jgi:hypothetical protein
MNTRSADYSGQMNPTRAHGARHQYDSTAVDEQPSANLNDHDQQQYGRTPAQHGQVYDSANPSANMGTATQGTGAVSSEYSGTAQHGYNETPATNYTTVPRQDARQQANVGQQQYAGQHGTRVNAPVNNPATVYDGQSQAHSAQMQPGVGGVGGNAGVKPTTGERIRGQIRQTMGELQDNPRKIAEGAAMKEGTHPVQTGPYATPGRRNV